LKTSDDSGAASVGARSARQRSGVRELLGVETAPLITVLTPTYNRAHLLGRVHELLLAQTFPRSSGSSSTVRLRLAGPFSRFIG
jgi:hypothetical protein